MGWGQEDEKKTFVWNKKLEKQGLKNLSRREIEAINKRKQLENIEELEKIKLRRIEIEKQKQARDEDLDRQQRSKELAQFDEWQKQEEKFHLEQAKLRSKIRIQDGRAKPIDLLAQYISDSILEETIEMQVNEPYTYLTGLSIDDYEDLLADIKVYNELESGKNSDYWNDITIIATHELVQLKKKENENSNEQSQVSYRQGIHQSVANDVTAIFKGKSTSQLIELQNKIDSKLSSGINGLDIGYWESLRSQLKSHLAKARLTDRHRETLKKKLEILKTESQIKSAKSEESTVFENSCSSSSEILKNQPNTSSSNLKKVFIQEQTYESDDETRILDECCKQYDEGRYSPNYISPSDLEQGTVVITPEVDENAIEELRFLLVEKEDPDDSNKDENLLLYKEAKRGMNNEEAQFSVEAKLDPQVYLWSDKYRPRKPRYFNRVHTGFEWNKYNQTHYDMDNPPPKVVQGYKFNIFYPDLIDKSRTPEYFLTACTENPDFVILKISAGPPYEDIAFKIVNREWEFSYKRGFRCQFQNNIFQLWFHFKRYRYRR